MGLEKELEDSADRLAEATDLLDGDAADVALGVAKGLLAAADGVRAIATHPAEVVWGIIEWLRE